MEKRESERWRRFMVSATLRFTSSRGGMNAIGILAQRYGRKIREDDQVLPVVKLASDSYKHTNKRFGEIDIPVFQLVGWATVDDVEDASETVVTPEVSASAPKAAARKAIEAPRKSTAAPSKKPDPKAAKKKSTRF